MRNPMRKPILLLALPCLVPMWAQTRALTTADYAHAEQFMPYNVDPLVYHGPVRATFLEVGRFYYRVAVPEGHEFILVDAAKGTKAPAFDHAKLAAALSAAAGAKYEAYKLPFTDFEMAGDSIVVDADGKRFRCDVAGSKCEEIAGGGGRRGRGGRGGGGRGGRGAIAQSVSPDGKRAVFIRDENLWSREVATGAETQLTKDGV